MNLRAADPNDQEFILMVRNDPATRSASRTDNMKDAAWYQDRLNDPCHFCYVAELNGTPIGYGSIQQYTALACEINIALSPAFRGMGLSHRLIDALVSRASEMGIERFLATIRGENINSLRAFLHEGFLPSKWVYLERRK